MRSTQKRATHSITLTTTDIKDVSKFIAVSLLGLLITVFLYGCSGGGSSTSGSSTSATAAEVASYKMPTEISAVPTSTNASVSSQSFTKKLRALARQTKAATDSGTDYSLAITKKYVEEHALEQFDMIEEILDAVAQTNYNDHIGDGAYKSMVAMNDEENGVEIKSLEPWIVQADAIIESGISVLRLRAWIEEEEGMVIKAEFKIYAPPTQNSDGSYADYGEWVLNVKFDETGINNFYALSCEATDDGALLKVHEKNTGYGPDEPASESKAVMLRGTATGYGKVSYPDYEAFWGPDGNDSLTSYPTISATYAYNTNFLTVKEEGKDAVYKNRNSVMEMTHRYGVFNNTTGDDIMRTKSFGFPIRYTDADGYSRHSYYGAWQGRHQIWTDGDPIPEGTTVTRDDTPPDEVITYEMGPTFNGVLVRRDLVDATLNDIKNIPVEIWINNDYNLTYNVGNSKWEYCKNIDWSTHPPSCTDTVIDFNAEIGLASLMVDPTDFKKNVHINGYDPTANGGSGGDIKFVYLVADSYDFNGDGVDETTVDTNNFYEATESNGKLMPNSPLTAIVPTSFDMLWVWMGGSIYVEYNGTLWKEKELVNFDERTWTPEFGSNDKDFILPEGKELYINMQGANYIVNKSGETTTVKLELQTAVNPGNLADVLPDLGTTTFVDSWNPDFNSTFKLNVDPTSDKYMMLVFKTIGDNHKDQDGTPQEGVAIDAIATNVWGISATINSVPSQFNWEYSSEGGWGSVSYLLDTNDDILYLDEALQFNPITVTNGAGDEKTLSLRFDGWMGGLPDMYYELEKSGWSVTEDISSKVINLPAGTALTDSATDVAYILKPLEISQFLVSVAEPDDADKPAIASANALNIDDVPNYVEHNMGATPTGVETLYSEGLPIE